MQERRNSIANSLEFRLSFTNPSICPLVEPGGRLNKKDGLTRYGDSHVKDKTS